MVKVPDPRDNKDAKVNMIFDIFKFPIACLSKLSKMCVQYFEEN